MAFGKLLGSLTANTSLAPIFDPADQIHDTVTSVLGNDQPIDTGDIFKQLGLPLNGFDQGEADPTAVDVDLLSSPTGKMPLLMVGLMPQGSDSWSAADVDILSASTGADRLAALDIGPDLGDQATIFVDLFQPDNPVDIYFQGNSLLGDLF